MLTTKQWAQSHGVEVADRLPAVEAPDAVATRAAEEVARRTIVLHCVAAAGYGVDHEPMVEWLQEQSVWEQASPCERELLSGRAADEQLAEARWRQEAQWALLWAVSRVESLGLPTSTCDTARLVDEIMPPLGGSVGPFVSSAQLRSPGELLAEDDRVYNLHCYARQAARKDELPDDLVYPVLFQRHYALEWLTGDSAWDDIQTDT